MKKALILILGVLLCSCSGVSTKDNEYMQTVLENNLLDMYHKSGYPVMFLRIEWNDVKKESYPGADGKYQGRFRCEFTENDRKISFYGTAGFDEKMQISSMPTHFGDNKLAIDIRGPYAVGSGLDAERHTTMPDDCKYILDCFMNRNKITGNDL